MRAMTIATVVVAALALGACSQTGKRVGYGAAAGAGVGAITTAATGGCVACGAAIGAGVGAAGGYIYDQIEKNN